MLATIDKYLNKHQEDALPSLQHVVHMILRETVATPVAGDPIDRDILGIAIRDLYERLERAPAVSEQVKIAQNAFEALKVYNCETTKFVKAQVLECSRALQSIRELVAADASASDAKLALEKIADQLAKAVAGPPMKPKPAALAEVPVVPPLVEIPPLVESISDETPAPEVDDVTGLPMRQEAETCVAGFIRENRKAYFLAVIIDQMSMIEKRYGKDVKENVLMFFSQLLSQTKKERDILFQWNDRCFLLLMNRVDERHYVRDEVATMLNSRYRSNSEVGGRSVMLNVGAGHKLWHVSDCTSASKFAAALDNHLAAVAS